MQISQVDLICKHIEKSVHKLPCTIKYDGTAPVQEYFTPTIEQDSSVENRLKATFRGRPLQGRSITLPKDTMGYVLQEEKKESESKWKTVCAFDQFVNWCLDANPDFERNVNGAIEWLEISKAIHEEVSLEEMTHEETKKRQREEENLESDKKQKT